MTRIPTPGENPPPRHADDRQFRWLTRSFAAATRGAKVAVKYDGEPAQVSDLAGWLTQEWVGSVSASGADLPVEEHVLTGIVRVVPAALDSDYGELEALPDDAAEEGQKWMLAGWRTA